MTFFRWDRKKQSLEATLQLVRPDLVPGIALGRPIPDAPPTKQFRRAVEKPTDEMSIIYEISVNIHYFFSGNFQEFYVGNYMESIDRSYRMVFSLL